MAPRKKTKETAPDPRTVKVRRPDGEEFTVTPEVARVLQTSEGWEVLGGRGAPVPTGDDKATTAKAIADAVDEATAPLLARIDDLEKQLEAKATANTNPPKGDDKATTAKEA